jgi:hypothetical protein
MDRVTAPAIGVLSGFIVTDTTNARAQPNHFVRAEYPVIGDSPGEQGISNAVTQSRDGVVEFGKISRFTVVDEVILFTATGGQPISGKRGQKDLFALAQFSQQRHKFGREVLDPRLVCHNQRSINMVFTRRVTHLYLLNLFVTIN